ILSSRLFSRSIKNGTVPNGIQTRTASEPGRAKVVTLNAPASTKPDGVKKNIHADVIVANGPARLPPTSPGPATSPQPKTVPNGTVLGAPSIEPTKRVFTKDVNPVASAVRNNTALVECMVPDFRGEYKCKWYWDEDRTAVIYNDIFGEKATVSMFVNEADIMIGLISPTPSLVTVVHNGRLVHREVVALQKGRVTKVRWTWKEQLPQKGLPFIVSIQVLWLRKYGYFQQYTNHLTHIDHLLHFDDVQADLDRTKKKLDETVDHLASVERRVKATETRQEEFDAHLKLFDREIHELSERMKHVEAFNKQVVEYAWVGVAVMTVMWCLTLFF
ncbi:hypothetical protein AAVH_40870, partial [Aphelenchoides avenae]